MPPICARRTSPRRSAQAIQRALGDGAGIVLVMGGSAIIDRRDVIPAAIERSGGKVLQFGMPVDPGNLILLGEIARQADRRPARLRAHAEAQRLRLGAAAPDGRHPGHARATCAAWAPAAC